MYKNTYIKNPLVSENLFKSKQIETNALPNFQESKNQIPQPFWKNKETVINAYWYAWETAFSNLYKPTKENGFVSNYIDTAYNGNIFMWDSTFMTLFGQYARNVFDFMGTLDNFYSKQHPDGFICREISSDNGQDLFHRFDHVSTGPNIMLYSEWQSYLQTGDVERLEKVFPVMVAYHEWLMHYRTWQDGTYFASGWATGMDNQPRMPLGYHQNFSHGHMVWLDTNLQQIISGKIIFKIGDVLERWQEIEHIMDETDKLIKFVNEKLYDEKTGFYHDLDKNGNLNSYVQSIGAYWGLLDDIFPKDRIESLCKYLENENKFNRPHMVPSLNFDHPKYQEYGRYWQGGVWAPTTYMVIKGLQAQDNHLLAHKIGLNHLENVVNIYNKTGTLWENYAPEHEEPAKPAKPNFVGWSGLAPISVLFEAVFGIISKAQENKVIWHINLDDEFGVDNYLFGKDNIISFYCNSTLDEPIVKIEAYKDLSVDVFYKGKKLSNIDFKIGN